MAIIKLILIIIFYTHIAKEICPPHISPTSDGFRKDGDVVLLREKLKEGALPRRDVPLHGDHQRAGGGGVGVGQGGGVGVGGGGGEGSEKPSPQVGEQHLDTCYLISPQVVSGICLGLSEGLLRRQADSALT